MAKRGYRVAEACIEVLRAQFGIELEDCLGCGAYGCIWPLEPGVVLKVFAAHTSQGLAEASALAFLLGLGDVAHPALPRVYALHELGGCLRGQYVPEGKEYIDRAYAAVREDVPDLVVARRERGPLSDALQYIETVYTNAVEVGDEDPTPMMRVWLDEIRATGALTFSPGGGNPRVSPIMLRILRQAVDLFAWGFPRGIVFGDAHLDNWGMRDKNQVVLRDLGAASGENLEDVGARVARLGDVGRADFLVLRGLRKWR